MRQNGLGVYWPLVQCTYPVGSTENARREYLVRRLWLSGLANRIQPPVGRSTSPQPLGPWGSVKRVRWFLATECQGATRQGSGPPHGFSCHAGETLLNPAPSGL